MAQRIAISGAARPHRPYRRWSASEKAWYLAAFRRSGLSGDACREMGVPRATFALWKREARRAGSADAPSVRRSRVTFARVAVVSPDAPPSGQIGEPRAGMRIMVRGAAGHEAALDGVDGPTAVRLVQLVLGRGR